MDQDLALAILLSGKTALLTGAAGTGKTFLLNNFISQARAMGKKVAITATTGLAATHLNGNTIHSWSGIGIRESIDEHFFDSMSKMRRDAISRADILIIDEISMLHDFRLDLIDAVLRRVRDVDVPFGGLQVVMSGDFFQLPPINREGQRGGNFVVYSNVWQEAKPTILYLSQQYRQEETDALSDILRAMRQDAIRRHHAEQLLARVEAASPDRDITELHTVNIDVDEINARRLADIDEEEHVYTHMTSGNERYIETLRRSVLAPETLTLKRGALVMAVKNSPLKTYVNGSIGAVVDFEPTTDYPIVQFRNGKEIVMTPEMWELRDGEQKRASISQIPLRLAWAITVHKSQGMTLDEAKIDLRKAFVEGMGYVALSRVRRLEDIYLYGINKTALKISDDAVAIDEVLRRQSTEAAKEFAYLREKMADVSFEKRTKKRANFSEKIAKMREKHPNAFRPWTEVNDADLRQMFLNGESVSVMAKKLGRHDNSIILRLKKLFGDDAIG